MAPYCSLGSATPSSILAHTAEGLLVPLCRHTAHCPLPTARATGEKAKGPRAGPGPGGAPPALGLEAGPGSLPEVSSFWAVM